MTIPASQPNTSMPIRFGCRLFTSMAPTPYPGQDKFIRSCLVSGENSLKKQSHGRDKMPTAGNGLSWEFMAPLSNSNDGWGLATYSRKAPHPTVNHSLDPISSDPSFEPTIQAHSQKHPIHTLLAHIRYATKGSVSLENAHPFFHKTWTFMHNGDLPQGKYQQLLDHNQQNVPLKLGIQAGATDSEAAFHTMLLKMHDQLGTTNAAEVSSEDLQRIFAETTAELVDSSKLETTPPKHPNRVNPRLAGWSGLKVHPQSRVNISPATNFVLSDGNRTLASCYGRTLYLGIHTTPQGQKEVLIASEKIQPRQNLLQKAWGKLRRKPETIQWWQIPNRHVVMLERKDQQIETRIEPF